MWAFWFVRICRKDTHLLDFRGDFFVRRINEEFPDVCWHLQRAKQRTMLRREAAPVYGTWGLLAIGRVGL